MRKSLIVLCALAVTGVASAATAPTYWTPAQMRALAPQLPGPLVVSELSHGSVVTRLAGTPTCVGIGTAKGGAFPGYRCAVDWKFGLAKGNGTLWVRPRAGSYCVSSTGFASCPAAPRPDDPRVCGTRSSSDRYAENCTMKAARTAVDRAVRAAGGIAVNLTCVSRSVFAVECDWGRGTATVTFSLGAAWKTNVVLREGS